MKIIINRGKVIKAVEENEEIDSIEDIEDIDLEKLEQIHPIVRRIFKLIPTGLINKFQKSQNEDFNSSEAENKETVEKHKSEITADELLPDSIDVYPAFTLIDYQDLEDIPDAVIDEFEMEEEYINKKSIFIEVEVDFPERKIEKLREMEEVPKKISDSQIEDNKDDLEYLFNLKEVLGWYEENLQKNGWKIIEGEKKEGFNNMFEHERDGYFIILDLENFLYTPNI